MTIYKDVVKLAFTQGVHAFYKKTHFFGGKGTYLSGENCKIGRISLWLCNKERWSHLHAGYPFWSAATILYNSGCKLSTILFQVLLLMWIIS